jgi:diguanylate cyclase (GGDEF)-like protein
LLQRKKLVYIYNLIVVLSGISIIYGTGKLIGLIGDINEVNSYQHSVREYSEQFSVIREIEHKWINEKLKTAEIESELAKEFHKLKSIEITLSSSELLNSTVKLFSLSEEYRKNSLQLFKHFSVLGLDHNSGLYGELRKEVHKFEDRLLKSSELQMVNSMLMLRRHEKDFMLRGLNSYLEKFENELQKLQLSIENSKLQDSSELSSYLNSYASTFRLFVSVQNMIGLSEKGGVILKNREVVREFEQSFSENILSLQKIHNQQLETLKLTIVLLLIVSIVVGVIFFLHKRENRFARDLNPLTALPGNRSIQTHIKYILRKQATHILYYFDFNNFKPFNDKYGFQTGDEVILLFAELLAQKLSCNRYFIGHIGGDDFFASITTENFEESRELVMEVQSLFESRVQEYYSKDEIERGSVVMKGRDGEERAFPLLSVSISALVIHNREIITTASAVNQIFAELKKSSKKSPNWFSAGSIVE